MTEKLAHVVYWTCSFQPNPGFEFWNSDPKIDFWVNFGRKSQSCLFFLKIGMHGILMMLILIPTLVFWIVNPKSIFGQIWTEKVKVVCFAWNLAHPHIHTSISKILILILILVSWNSKPKSIFWTNLSRKTWILHFA